MEIGPKHVIPILASQGSIYDAERHIQYRLKMNNSVCGPSTWEETSGNIADLMLLLAVLPNYPELSELSDGIIRKVLAAYSYGVSLLPEEDDKAGIWAKVAMKLADKLGFDAEPNSLIVNLDNLEKAIKILKGE